MEILLLLLIALCFLTINMLLRTERRIKKINRTLKEIIAGNYNQYFRIRPTSKGIRELVSHLNKLTEELHNLQVKTKRTEEEQKRMISNISHDLRTPLTSLLGYIEVLQNEGLPEEEKRKYLSIIQRKGTEMSTLIEYFFELAKIEAGDIAIELRRVNISEILQDTLLDFYDDFVKYDITPQINIPHHPFYVQGDSFSIKRILNNLFANAIHYGKEGKIVGVELRDEKDKVGVDVWNRGAVVSRNDLEHIFDRTYTGEYSRNPSIRGNGLGLAIVKGLVELQDGNIVVEKKEEDIIVFSFYLKK